MMSKNLSGSIRMNNDKTLTIVVRLTRDEMEEFILEEGYQPEGMIKILVREVKQECD